MVPKKLTDCPENLRESIDWLIQVRHGSGPDKNGLDGLAKALKTLIDEAITKATKSLEAEHDKLVCPFQYSATETNCQHYETLLENRKKEIQDSGNPQDFEKDAEVKCLKGNIADCRNKYHNERYRDPSKQKALDDIEDRQKKLEGLKIKLVNYIGEVEDKVSNSIPAKHILENLTDGLEKLLGFDPSSKGYDGSGIVYSDLDRLCDGVMGFLSGVLSNIKEHLGQHKETITPVINILKEKKHTGKKGFNGAIAEVFKGVGRYNKEVKKSNESLCTPIIRLYESTKKRGKWSNDVNDMQVRNGTEEEVEKSAQLVRDCVTKTIRFNTALDIDKLNEIKTSINDLNPTLCARVQKVREFVKHETDTMKCYSKLGKEREKLNEMVKIIETTFENLRRGVKQKIKREVNELVRMLIDRVKKLLEELMSINDRLEKNVEYLHKSIKSTERFVNNALKKVEEILVEVDDPNNHGNKKAVEEAAKKIQMHTEILKDKFDEVKKQYYNVFTKIKGTNGEGDENGCVMYLLNEAHNKVIEPNQLEVWKKDGGDNLWNLKRQIEGLTKQIESNVEAHVKLLSSALSDAVGKANETLQSDQEPGLEALKDTELWNLPKLGARLDGGHADPIFRADIERVLTNLKNVAVGWGSSRIKPSLVYQEIVTGLGEALTKQATEGSAFDNQLGSLLQAAAATGEDNLHNIIKSIVESQLKTIEMLETTIEEQAHVAYNSLLDQASAVTYRLRALCENVANVADAKKPDGLKTLLNNFKIENIIGTKENQLNKIIENLSQLQSELVSRPLVNAQEFVASYANKAEKQYLEIITQYVDGRVKESKNVITNAVRKEYVTHVKGMLQAFSERVTEDLHDLPAEITQESDKNYKGFMKILQSKLTGSNLPTPLTPDNKLVTLSANVKTFFSTFFEALTPNRDVMPETRLVDLQSKLTPLFTDLTKYNREFSTNLTALNTLLNEMLPESYAHQNNPLLQILRDGIKGMCDELDKAYVSVYDSVADVIWTDQKSGETSLVGKKCATVFFTTIDIMLKSLFDFRRSVTDKSAWKDYKMYDSNYNHSLSSLFFNKNGYDHGLLINAEYGELNHKNEFTGQRIVDLFKSNGQVTLQPSYDILASLDDFADIIKYYSRVSHLGTFSSDKHPLNTFHMLAWLSGLKHNPVKEKLTKYLQNQSNSEIDVTLRNKLWEVFTSDLPSIYTPAYDLIASIVGYGDVDTLYACQYMSNTLELHYPSDAVACFDMLLDVLRKLCPVLQFLYWQCKFGAKNLGWRDCHYGKNAGTSSWKCKEHSDQTSNCQRISPLMSYLTDCLLGHLPHQLQSVGCTSKCSTCSSSSPNMPCLTPLGFRTFSGSTRTGKDLCSVLDKLCGNRGVLTKLYASVACFVGRPPQTFPDIFAFYYQLVQPWNPMTEYKKPSNSIQQALGNSIEKTVSCKYDDAKQFMNQCRSLYESPSHLLHDITRISDMSYLVGCGEQDCGYIVRPLNSAAYGAFSPKHAKSYLSWLVHVCPQLVEFFKQLQKAFSDVSCADSRCSPCLHSESCTKGKHGTTSCGCSSIVHCQPVSSILYKYGLMYADAANKSQIKCQDFSNLLKNILNSQVLGNFLHAIDTLMFTIRTPFIWTVVALWSLSLLYLFYVLLGRLDTLHIRSHLRSPASYKIAAQSLLAAARVGKLAKISYLQA